MAYLRYAENDGSLRLWDAFAVSTMGQHDNETWNPLTQGQACVRSPTLAHPHETITNTFPQTRTQHPEVAITTPPCRSTQSNLRTRSRQQYTTHLPPPQPAPHDTHPSELQSLHHTLPLHRPYNRPPRHLDRRAPSPPPHLLRQPLRLPPRPALPPNLLPNLHGSLPPPLHPQQPRLRRNRAPLPLH
jgi:hypothetical protein